ncbi:MAG TPA: transglutaminase-like domain-containing protein [Mycobacteriales bacterium]|nr:transglutaminase-like domain-containing protein [Mycobacteriales bacterium]
MTTLLEPQARPDTAEDPERVELGGFADEPPGPEPAEESDEAVVEVGRPSYVALSAASSTLGAAWLAAHLFHSVAAPFLCAALGVLLGTGLVWLSTRFERRSLLQYAAVPVLALAGAILTTTAPGGGGSLPSLINRTIHTGGLRNPPVPFDPGWRFLAVVLFGFLAAAATSAALTFARPKLAVGLPSLVTLAVALLQPKDGGLGATVGAVVLVVAGLALAFGADLARQVSTGAGFEARRLIRGAVLLAVAVAILVGIAQSSFLFPATKHNAVIPPRKPPASPALPPNQVLFSVRSSAPGPWRLGVLDSYGDNAFLLPSVDASRLQPLTSGGVVAPAPHPIGKKAPATYDATITIGALLGQTLPGPPQLESVHGVTATAGYDPETQLVSLSNISVRAGLTYTTTAPALPSGTQLQHDHGTYAPALKPYTDLPPPPQAVLDLLAKAPTKDDFDRLQFLRSKLLDSVVAAGSGRPVDIVPSQVSAMLAGGKATPYEIVAAQVMLARWAGIPARIGYGFYGGSASHGVTTFRPVDGSAWLEANFPGYGWVPIIGTPRKAEPSISQQPKKKAKITPTDQLALSLYIPVRQLSVRLVYEEVRYYAWRALAIIGGLLFVVVCYPVPLKLLRRARRRRWAGKYGGSGRAIAAYAEFRDRCYDLNIGDPRLTPLEFVTAVEADAEHEELAWLFTRVVWGDLRRDLQDDDLAAVEEMARSVGRRVAQQQPGTNRFVAAITRASLRDPWTSEIPNAWLGAS